MKRKSSIITITPFIVILFLVGLTLAAEKKSEEIKVVNRLIIISDFDRVKPNTLTTKPGTTVIWVNHSRFPIEIWFLDKKGACMRFPCELLCC